MRLALVAFTLVALFAAWQAARWYMGSEIASIATQIPADPLGAARTAVRLAPSDPLAHWSLATMEQRDISPEQAQAAMPEYEKAVSLSPMDFRLWVDLGRARERVGDFAGSEKALRRSVELAPYYAWPRWHLGNFLVRRGRNLEGLAELQRVAAADPSKRSAVFDLAWYISGGDTQTAKDLLGDSTAIRAGFAQYLLGRQRPDDALQIWSSLSSADKKENSGLGEKLLQSLLAAKRFRTASALAKEIGRGGSAPEVGKISNGSFESPVVQNNTAFFDWHVSSIPQAQAGLDPADARDGNLSLRVSFNAPGALNFNITQMVAVEPATSYRLLFYVRGNNLKSAAMPIVQVVAPDGKVLGESQSVEPGKTDWRQITVDFRTPPDVDGVTVRIARAPCTMQGAMCPIFGTVWYDDFNLQFVGREPGA